MGNIRRADPWYIMDSVLAEQSNDMTRRRPESAE